jgi:hypothetical protein
VSRGWWHTALPLSLALWLLGALAVACGRPEPVVARWEPREALPMTGGTNFTYPVWSWWRDEPRPKLLGG